MAVRRNKLSRSDRSGAQPLPGASSPGHRTHFRGV